MNLQCLSSLILLLRFTMLTITKHSPQKVFSPIWHKTEAFLVEFEEINSLRHQFTFVPFAIQATQQE